ncbi:cell wall protein RBR3 [Ricinus communis]|uniref:cell wall protein RBR3 n=1 Tax=Ricinus communis TaxID=3988 RepID=UPI00201A2B68|nr:cell wall protein RBR3 [Ricinus communis]
MCSNSSHSSSGGGVGGDNGVDSIYSKKPKRQRVPKRGPGVAELEKILREQEKRNDIEKAKSDGYSLVSSLPNSYHPQPLALASSKSLPQPRPVSFSPHPKQFTPPNTTYSIALVGKSGVQIAGSNLVLPEHTLLPTMWSSSETKVGVGVSRSVPGFPFSARSLNGSNPSPVFPDPSLMQRSQNTPSSAKDLFPHCIVSSSTTPSSSIPCHGREPPSNQTTYYHTTPLWPEEDQMVGAKRSRPFSMEIPPVPVFHYPVPTFSPQINRLDPSFSCGNGSSIEASATISREKMPSSSLEPNIEKCNTDNGSLPDGSFLLFGCPTTPPSTHTLQRELSKFSHFPLQESNGGGSIHKKPFYSFLLPREHIGMVESLNNERTETRGDGIDLNLRL